MDFGHTTISNLKGTDDRLWVHIVLAILFLPLGIAIMRHFSVNLGIRDENEEADVASRTLMIAGVPETYCTKEFIHRYATHVLMQSNDLKCNQMISCFRHIEEAYDSTNIVEEVQVAYDVSKLNWLNEKRECARRARQYCENHAMKVGSGQQMKPMTCGIMCMACNCDCCKNSVDALTFYKKEESDYASEVTREKARVRTKSIGIAFVTFSRLADARKMVINCLLLN